MAKPPLLIFGELAPIGSLAAGHTAQAALYLEQYAAITVIIADHAPVPTKLPDGIQIKRHRDLPHLTLTEQAAARLFILGDTAASLDTLKLYERFPGPVIVATKSLYHLFVAHLKTQDGWPFNYTSWLKQCFGEKTEIITQALLRRGRESRAIAEEIPVELIFPNIYQHQVSLPQFIADYPTSFFSTEGLKPNVTSAEPTAFKLITIGPEEGAAQTIKNLRELGHNIIHGVLQGADPNLAEKISQADAVLISEGRRSTPAYLPLVLQANKPLITTGQRWAKAIAAPSFNAPHAGAIQHITAAIGAIVTQPTIRAWLQAHSKHLSEQLSSIQFEPQVAQIMQTPDLALTIEAPMEAKAPPSQGEESPGNAEHAAEVKGPVALIGAVPPKTILSSAFPEIDLNKSPKFATRALCETLQSYSDSPLPILLSQLGYEAMVVDDPAQGSTYSPSAVLQQLKLADEALSFGTQFPAVFSADRHISKHLKAQSINIPVRFPPTINEKEQSGYEAASGLLWSQDTVRDMVSCVFILGTPGRYRLSLEGSGNLTIATLKTTHRLNRETPLRLETNSTGVLYFTLSIENNSKNQEDCSEILTKSLADYPLNLEWLDHD